jgi:hypothetical protein
MKNKKNLNTSLIAIALLIVLIGIIVSVKVVSFRQYKKEKEKLEILTESILSGADKVFSGEKERIDIYIENYNEALFNLIDEPGDGVFLSNIDAVDWDLSVLSKSTGKVIKRFGINLPALSETTYLFDEMSSNIASSQTVYVYFDPMVWRDYYDKYESEKILYKRQIDDSFKKYAMSHPDSQIKFLLPIKSIKYWAGLSQSEFDAEMTEWSYWVEQFNNITNVQFYCLGCEEWLLVNDNLYKDNGNLIEDMTKNASSVTFCDGEYLTAPINLPIFIEKIETSIEKFDAGVYDYPHKSNSRMLFLGDSVLANSRYEDFSVSSVVGFLTGARTYNLSKGGTSATDTGNENSFVGVTRLLKDRSLPSEGYENRENFQRFYDEYKEGDDLFIVIYYGFNDYFCGNKLDGEGNTFYASVKTGLENLKETFPDAKIIVVDPHYVGYFEGGTAPFTEGGASLPEYISVLKKVSEEEEVYNLDAYNESDINEENMGYYLADLVHPTEAGAFKIGQFITDYITGIK